MKYDLPYFSHYSTTHNEPKMQALLAEYGYEGYGRYWILCEKIAASPNAILDISSRVIKLTIARTLELSVEDFDDFIEFLNAPDIKLVSLENNIVTTDLLQENYLKVAKKRERNKTDYQKSLTDFPIQTSETSIQTSENTQSKVEYSTVDQSKEDKSSSSKEISTTTLFINLCKDLGYAISSKKAQETINAGIEPDWLSEPSYPERIANKIQEEYSDKPPEEKQKLFISLLTQADIITGFPEWRKTKEAGIKAQEERQQHEAAAREKQKELDAARVNRPKNCKCGEKIEYKTENMGICPACNFRYLFNETGTWEESDVGAMSLSELFQKHRIKNNRITVREDIDF